MRRAVLPRKRTNPTIRFYYVLRADFGVKIASRIRVNRLTLCLFIINHRIGSEYNSALRTIYHRTINIVTFHSVSRVLDNTLCGDVFVLFLRCFLN